MSAFTIDAQDFDFYKKIAVPPPTFCPECRMQRRFAWRNERTLFRNTCAATGKKLIAGFSPESGITVYDRDYWWSDAWDPLAFGADYDFSQPFFVQFRKLVERVPMPAVFNARTTNTLYANYAGEYKDGYMVSASWEGENVAYASQANSTKDSVDVYKVKHCNLCYEDVGCEKMYRTHFSDECENCTDSWFLYGCKGCSSCFGCTNLRNKSYWFFNEPLTKEAYREKVDGLYLGSARALEEIRARFEALKSKTIRKYANNVNAPQCTGDRIYNASNCTQCFDICDTMRDCKYLINALQQMTDSYDGYGVGAHTELQYEAFDSGVQGQRQCFVGTIYGGANIFYSLNCHGSSNLFGCIGLRNKEYCIFNRQYSPESFDELRTRIIEHMSRVPYIDPAGIRYGYGEFFPMNLSPFAYNESVAQEYFPLTSAQAEAKGYVWREPERPAHAVTRKAAELPDDIADVKDDIYNEIVACMACGRAYRIIRQELDFLRHVGIPLPRLCVECRHRNRFLQVNPPRLYHRACMCAGLHSAPREAQSAYKNTAVHAHGEGKCLNEFETSYSPERPEIIYCESCYNSEVV